MSNNTNVLKEMQDWSPEKIETKNISITEYLSMVLDPSNNGLSDLAHARMYRMIESYGIDWAEDDDGETKPNYKFFESEIYGLKDTLEKMVGLFHSGGRLLPSRKRIIMLMGPVGGGKSTIVSMLKKGLGQYSKIDKGKIYSIVGCPIHEDPLHALPEQFIKQIKNNNNIYIEGKLCPICQHKLDKEFDGDFRKFEVERIFFSEQSRTGIGTFAPSDTKCLRVNSTILTSNGQLKLSEIGNSFKEQDQFIKLDDIDIVNFEGKKEKASHYYYNGIQDTLKIKSKLGFEIECTKVHPLRVLSNNEIGWKKAEDIVLEDKIQIQYGTGLYGKNDKVNEEQARFIGYFISEGYLHYPKYNVEISNNADYIYKDIYNIVKNNWGYECKHYEQKRIVISNKQISDWIVENVLAGETKSKSQTKEIPLCIRNSSKHIQLQFLKGLYAGDGCFRLRSDQDSLQITYGTSFKELSTQLQVMLLNMGYIAAKNEYTHKYNNSQQYNIYLNGDQALFFGKEIDMFEEKYISHNDKQIKTNRSNFNLIDGVRDEITQLVWALPASIRHRYTRYGNTCQEQNQRSFTRNSCQKFLELIYDISKESEELTTAYNFVNNALENKTIWLDVVDIQENGLQEVADLTVPETHSFVSNGIVSHNSQDIAELIGSINLSKIADIGVESDPRAFTFDGELNIANRGMIELIEALKCDEKFLYVFLTLAQENLIKTPKFPLIYEDMVILAHTNETEWVNFMQKPENEALRDRIITIICPYVLEVDNESQIYEKEWKNSSDASDVAIAPRTFDLCASFAILSRLEEPADKKIDIVKKMKAYNGEEVEGLKRQEIKQMKKEIEREGMFGIGPRSIMNAISKAATDAREEYYNLTVEEKSKMCYGLENIEEYGASIDAIDMMKVLSESIDQDPELKTKQKESYKKLLEMAREELDKKLKEDIQKAFCFEFEKEAEILFENYLNNVIAFINKEKIKDPITGKEIEPDESLMKSVENMINVGEGSKEQHRQTIVNRFSRASQKGKAFDFNTHSDLREAITAKIFEDRKDTIQITTTALHPDKEKLSELNRVIKRLIEQGYTPYSAAKMVRYVGKLLNR